MGGGGGTQRTRTEPWSGQSPYLQDVFGQAQALYRGGPQRFYPGPTVAPFSPQTQAALDLETQRAMGGDPTQRALGGYLTGAMAQPNIDPRAIAQGGMGAMGNLGLASQQLQQAGMAAPTYGQAAQMAGVGGDLGLPGAAQFAGGVTSPYTQALMGGTDFGRLGEAGRFFGADATPSAPGPTGMAQLGATAGGAYMPGRNPYLDQMYQTGAERIGETFREQTMPELAGMFGTAGRTGSGAQALMAGRAAGDVAGELRGLYGDIYAPAYEAERGRQLQAAGTAAQQDLQRRQAAGQLFGQMGQLGLGGGQLAADLYRAGMGGDIQRRQLAGDIYGQGLGRMATTGAQLGQLGLGGLEAMRGLRGDLGTEAYRAATLAPGFQQMQYADIDRLLRGGGQIEDQTQRLMDAARERYMFEQGAPYQALGQYANIIQGMPSGYGTTTRPGQGGSRIAGALGGGLSGWAATGGNPIGAGIGAIGGLLAAR